MLRHDQAAETAASGDVLTDRRSLTDPAGVVEQMARDVLAARRDGILGLVDLTEHGWTLAQVVRFGSAAHALAATPAFATQDVVERLREDEPGEGCIAPRVVPRTGDMVALVDHLEQSGDAA